MRKTLLAFAAVAAAVATLLAPAAATAGPASATEQARAEALASARAVPSRGITLEQARSRAAQIVLPTARPEIIARPYGSELFDSQISPPNGTVARCTTAYNAVSAAAPGAKYVITAGHCEMETPSLNGKTWYPANQTTQLIGDTGHRSAMDTVVGDFGVVRANKVVGTLYRQLRHPATGAVVSVTHAADPVRFEPHISWGGNSHRVYHGFTSFIDQCADIEKPGQISPPTVHVCNLSINQIDIRAEGGCPIPGDSGGPGTVQSPTEGLLADGIVVARAFDEVNCWVWETQLGTAMTKWGLSSAPLP